MLIIFRGCIMNRKGFISTAALYSFFLVFCMLLILIMTTYTNNRVNYKSVKIDAKKWAYDNSSLKNRYFSTPDNPIIIPSDGPSNPDNPSPSPEPENPDNPAFSTEGYKTILINNGGGNTTYDSAINYIKGKSTPTFSKVATTNEGMFAAIDSQGTSYYFRGAVNNNWIKYGKDSSNKDIYWRIIRINGDKIQDAVVGELQDFDFWIMSSLKVTYTAGSNISISNDNVISANVSGGTDANAVYTYYAPYSDEDWFTEENVANILQTVKDKGYSNFELCTLNGNHYALRQGGNLQNLTTEGESYQLEYLQNDLKNYVYYFFVARLNEGGKIVVDGLGTQTYTAQEMVEANLSPTLEKMSGYDGSASHLILQANNGVLEWDSSLDGGIFGDNYTDPAYYTEKQVDKIVTDTVNEALGGRY